MMLYIINLRLFGCVCKRARKWRDTFKWRLNDEGNDKRLNLGYP